MKLQKSLYIVITCWIIIFTCRDRGGAILSHFDVSFCFWFFPLTVKATPLSFIVYTVNCLFCISCGRGTFFTAALHEFRPIGGPDGRLHILNVLLLHLTWWYRWWCCCCQGQRCCGAYFLRSDASVCSVCRGRS